MLFLKEFPAQPKAQPQALRREGRIDPHAEALRRTEPLRAGREGWHSCACSRLGR